jgi:hypothetical protein
MTIALSTVAGNPRTTFYEAPLRAADHESSLTSAEPGPATQRTATDAIPDIVEEWGRQSFPASDPPANW